MRGDEARIVEAFRDWLIEHGWSVRREIAFVDVVATCGSRTLFAEAKGRTAAVGLDVDTLYGQLLRRMPADAIGTSDFAVVVPDSAAPAALRVPERVRQLLRIHVDGVSGSGKVQLSSTAPDPVQESSGQGSPTA